MKRPARPIRFKLAQVERLLDDTFAGERGVAVDEERHAAHPVAIAGPILLRAHAAERDRIHELQVARVEAEGEVHRPARGGPPVRAVTEVVLHVPSPVSERVVAVLELAEDLARALAEDVRQDVQAPAVGHAQHDLVHPVPGRRLDGKVQERDQALGPLQGKALGAKVLLLDELLEDDGVSQPSEDAKLLLPRQADPVPGVLQALSQPRAAFAVVDVHELGADRLAIRGPQDVQDLPERAGRRSGNPVRRVGPVEVGVREAVERRVQLGLRGSRPLQGIDPGGHVTPDQVGANQLHGPVLPALVARRVGERRAGPVGPPGIEKAPGPKRRAGLPASVSTVHAVEALEVPAPVRIDRGRVAKERPIQILHVAKVRGIRKRHRFGHVSHSAHHDSPTRHPAAAGRPRGAGR